MCQCRLISCNNYTTLEEGSIDSGETVLCKKANVEILGFMLSFSVTLKLL
jgi:hypothetical protein